MLALLMHAAERPACVLQVAGSQIKTLVALYSITGEVRRMPWAIMTDCIRAASQEPAQLGSPQLCTLHSAAVPAHGA